LGLRALWGEDYGSADAYFSRTLAIARELDHAQHIVGALINLGDVARIRGNRDAASALYEEGITFGRREGISWAIPVLLANMGRVTLQMGNVAEAKRLLVECLVVAGGRQMPQDRAWALALVAQVLLDEGKHEQACKVMGATEALLEMVGADAVSARSEDIERVVQEINVLRSDPANARCWEEGRKLGPEETLAFVREAASQ
jgi:hypothetical protein